MSKLKLAVIFGGASSEYDISLMSATSVIKNIDWDKYDVLLIGVTKKGDFYLYTGDISLIEKDLWFNDYCQKISFSSNRSDHGIINLVTGEIINIDLAFPIMHGMNGEDGRLQGLLELADIPYIGCDLTSSAICMNKYLAHEIVKTKDVLVPKAYLFDYQDELAYIENQIANLNWPIFVKPLRAGSSLGITRINNMNELPNALELAKMYDNQIIIEEGINGFEVGCAIMGNRNLIVGEVDEIEMINGFFDFEQKYHSAVAKSILPARLAVEERERIKKEAIKIYKALGCHDFARVDMFYTDKKEIYFNEVNSIPGFTSHSRYPSMLNSIGYSFPQLIEELINIRLNEIDKEHEAVKVLRKKSLIYG